jgi:tRNA C32,U32 (ribose-2'-O)-methylase TrmJ
MAALDAHLDAVLTRVGFMHEGNAEQLAPRIRRMLARAVPDAGEVRILRGLLAAIERRVPPPAGRR